MLKVRITYEYDAWGNTISVKNADGVEITNQNSFAHLNPIRYRGYYYDTETGLYYLNSRYYDPEIGRFINADTASVVKNSPMVITDKNLFAYCDNNPVTREDSDGEFWETAIDVVSLALSVADVVKDPSDPWAWAGLVGDAIDLVPFVTGVGEITRGVKIAKRTIEAVDKVDDIRDAGKIVEATSESLNTLRKTPVIGKMRDLDNYTLAPNELKLLIYYRIREVLDLIGDRILVYYENLQMVVL